jgi:AbrB family looped-hinge helix DNA binding protein
MSREREDLATATWSPILHLVTRLSAGILSDGVILLSMTHRVGPKGQVVIPKALRDQLGIVPGDEVDFALEDGVVRVEPIRERSSLRGSFAGLGLTSELEADRRAERDR